MRLPTGRSSLEAVAGVDLGHIAGALGRLESRDRLSRHPRRVASRLLGLPRPGLAGTRAGAPAALRTIIERWYAEIDSAIGRLSAACDERTAVIVSLRRLAGW